MLKKHITFSQQTTGINRTYLNLTHSEKIALQNNRHKHCGEIHARI